MGWGRYFLLGDLGQQFDIADLEESSRRMRRSLLDRQYAERDTEANIEELFKENRELRVYLTAVIQLLISKGTITSEEMSTLAEAVEQSAQPAPVRQPPTITDTEPESSAELEELAKAVEETDRNAHEGYR